MQLHIKREEMSTISNFVIYPLHLGTITREKSMMAFNLNPGTKLELPILAWYLTDGRQKILVDTGGIEPDGIRYEPYKRTEEQCVERALLNLGIKAEEIEIVILTHLHWDHASNNHLFPKAKFYVQKKELQYAVTPIPIHVKSYNLEDILKTRYEIVDGDEAITEGISLILTPGHSPGSQTVLVDTEKGKYAIVGDLFNILESWEKSPKIANGFHTDLIECYDSFKKVEKAADFVLPGHEPKVLEHASYPY